MSARTRMPLAALVAAVAVLAGCGGDDNNGNLGDVRANGTDAAFVEAMIPHHEDEVDAADLALSEAQHRPLKQLAEGILQIESVELSTLRTVRDVLQEASVEPDDLGLSVAEMGGQIAPAELRNATDFDCAFLERMIPHHEGAIRIARAELDGAIHAELRRMSENIVDQQGFEARQMRRYQRAWCDAP
jgi:uncharacterized protein (DUF305 family)